jgi:hypothetical protein
MSQNTTFRDTLISKFSIQNYPYHLVPNLTYLDEVLHLLKEQTITVEHLEDRMEAFKDRDDSFSESKYLRNLLNQIIWINTVMEEAEPYIFERFTSNSIYYDTNSEYWCYTWILDNVDKHGVVTFIDSNTPPKEEVFYLRVHKDLILPLADVISQVMKKTNSSNVSIKQKKNSSILLDDEIQENSNSTEDVINKIFKESFPEDGWSYAFRKKEDYDKFVRFLAYYLEKGSLYKGIENGAIKIKSGKVTKMCKALGVVHRELSNVDVRKNDLGFFTTLRVLDKIYKKYKDDNNKLYKAISRT